MPSDRHIEVSSPLGKELLFHRMRMTEELGRMFHLDLELLSHNHDIALDSLLGKNISIHMKTKDGRERYFHGIATHFSHVGSHEHYAHYTATLRPWLWLLTRTADCRIFQKKDGVNTAPDIIKKVFRDHGFTNFDDRLTRTDYRDREYTVQYRESAFNFVSRLMEHEGIYYFFEHEKSQHTLVLADSYSAHSNAPGYVKIPYFPPDSHSRREEEHFNDVTVAQEVQPGQYKVESFDFEKPKAVLQASSAKAQSHDHSSLEVFDYPADYSESSEGENYARIRLEEFQAQYEVVSAAGDACGVGTGNLFTLEDHPRQTLNQEYLVVSSTHELVMGSYESGSTGSSTEMKDSIQIHAIESHTPFRCEETTPNPVIHGPHTAIVVGKKGEEIWTEEHGRVKVQFHWDREGKLDEQSSCWVRVSQIWAGKGWGGMELPRMGQEVIVHFMAGDPDQPIVTGRVYNENHKVPYELPANQTQSGIKSRSTMGGSAENFNEIRFEDKKGKEIVTIHAERNLSTTVEADETLSVGNDRTKTVGHDEKAEVKNEQHQGISQSQFLMVGAAKHEKVAAESACNVGGQLSLTVAGDVVEVFESAHSEDVTGTYFLKATGDLVIESVASVTLKCGPSTIVLDPSGVSVEAAKITLNASGMTMINSGPGSPPKDGTAGTATEPTEPTLGGANEG